MRRIIPILVFHLIVISITVTGENQRLGRSLDQKLLGLKKEKLSHFRFYWHDTYSGSNPTVVPIVKSPMNTTSGFGFMSMIDDPLTEGPEMSSKLMGKAQGFYGSADQKQPGLLMVMNFVFGQGKYNGSTLSIFGRNQVFSKKREMPVIGGTGLFRFARGYIEASTYSFNQNSGDAIVEYNAYILHY
ncbi:Disease resistance-responsive (dirigent-like protein) family protein [Euphorbia peplus]|nr:Disease resistance-responsive (dirigent-like protein) family protein [Euphorbia peplus]